MVKTLVLVVVIAAISGIQGAQNDKECVPKFPGFFINPTQEAIFQGCFHSDGQNSPLPKSSIANYRSIINWYIWIQHGYAKDIIDACGKKAMELGVSHFAVEFYGECYFGNTPNLSGRKLTESDGCNNLCSTFGVGGASVMAVYKVENWAPQCSPLNVGYYIDDSHWAWNRGCYNQDKIKYVFPQDSFISRRSEIDWGAMTVDGHGGDMVKKCGLVALAQGASYFGIEYYGNCFYGNIPHLANGELPCKPQLCFIDIGIKDSLQLYKVMDV